MCATGWAMYFREAQATRAFREESRDNPVAVPYSLIDRVKLFATTIRVGVKVEGSPSLRLRDSAWNELNGLVLAAMLGVTNPRATANAGWARVGEMPKELADITQKCPIEDLDKTQRRWVYFELDDPVTLGELKVSKFMLFAEVGEPVSDLYVDDGKGAWLHAVTTVSAGMLEAYIRDATMPDPD